MTNPVLEDGSHGNGLQSALDILKMGKKLRERTGYREESDNQNYIDPETYGTDDGQTDTAPWEGNL